MRINFMCVFCGSDTLHTVGKAVFVDGEKTTSELVCTVCNNYPVHVKHKTGELPIYNSERVLFPSEERGKKEVQYCPVCQKENWGRSVKKVESIIKFKCAICENTSEIILVKKKSY